MATLATEGLEDILAHLLPRWRSWCGNRRTWSMIRAGRVVRSRTDYILGTDHRLYWNVSVRDPRHNSDHYMVLVYLYSPPPPEGTLQIPRGEQAAPPTTANHPEEGV